MYKRGDIVNLENSDLLCLVVMVLSQEIHGTQCLIMTAWGRRYEICLYYDSDLVIATRDVL
jgi:hypothetical protein